MTLAQQFYTLLLLALPVACVAWTVTHEEIFREPREYCVRRSKSCRNFVERKFFYLFTCEYCFSHYIAAIFLFIARYKLLFTDWRGYLLGFFALVWIANIYMGLFGLLRQGIKNEKISANIKEELLQDVKEGEEEKIKKVNEAVEKLN